MLDGSHKEPGCGAGDGAFEVFSGATVAVKPCEGTLYDPATRDKFKAFCRVRAFDDLERPIAFSLQSGAQILACITPVGEDMTQPWEGGSDGFED